MNMHAGRYVHNAAWASFRALLLALLMAVGACMHLPEPAGQATGAAPKNIIILFADGVASTQWELGRVSSRYLRNAPFLATDVVMRNGALGLMSNVPADALVTDSAAAATAMSTGHKTDNDMVAMLPDGKPVETLMEAARAAGKRVGLVTTAPVYDATPAAFTVHARGRYDSQSLVDQYVVFEPDVLMGGGRDYFVPKARAGGKRSDDRDVIALFTSRGYDYVHDADSLRRTSASRLLGLFADGDMAFEIDRDTALQPSMADMAAAALRALAQRSPQGFVLLLENENTDSAGHRNDIAALIRDLWAFDAAVKVALDFQREYPETLVVITGDHETGGLSVTNALSELYPADGLKWFYASNRHLDMVARIGISLDKAVKLLGRSPDGAAVDRVITQHFPGFVLDADLREAILQHRRLERNFGYTTSSALSRMVSRQTAIYWGTTGHTSQPAVVGSLGPGAERFRGYMDNTEFATRLKSLLGPQRETAAAPR